MNKLLIFILCAIIGYCLPHCGKEKQKLNMPPIDGTQAMTGNWNLTPTNYVEKARPIFKKVDTVSK